MTKARPGKLIVRKLPFEPINDEMPREVAYLNPETIVKEPTLADVQSIAEHYGLSLSQADAEGQLSWMSALLRGFSAIDNLPDSFPEIRYPRRSSSKVSPDQNPLGAWWVKTEIDRASSGKLRGRTIAIKDNVFVAGVPLMNGASILEGYVPPFDATIVTRILDAGGKSSASPFARRTVPQGEVIPVSLVLCTIRIAAVTPQEALHREAERWSLPARWTWPSAVIRADRSEFRPRGVASMA